MFPGPGLVSPTRCAGMVTPWSAMTDSRCAPAGTTTSPMSTERDTVAPFSTVTPGPMRLCSTVPRIRAPGQIMLVETVAPASTYAGELTVRLVSSGQSGRSSRMPAPSMSSMWAWKYASMVPRSRQ